MGRLVLLFVIIAALAGCSRKAKPAISLNIDSVYDFGKVTTEDTIKHVFHIKNTGGADLQIIKVTASCDCMNLNWQKTAIKPGETGLIKVAVLPNKDIKMRASKFFAVRTNSINPIVFYRFTYNW